MFSDFILFILNTICLLLNKRCSIITFILTKTKCLFLFSSAITTAGFIIVIVIYEGQIQGSSLTNDWGKSNHIISWKDTKIETQYTDVFLESLST